MPYLFESSTPSYLLVSRAPLSSGNPIHRISTSEAGISRWFGEKSFKYKENIQINGNTRQIEQDPELLTYFKQEIEHRLKNPLNDSLVVCHIDKTVGYGVFTTQAIEMGDIIGIYAGQIPDNNGLIPAPSEFSESVTSGDYVLGPEGISTNAGYIGGITRFIQHMPLHKKAFLNRIDAAAHHEEAVSIGACFGKVVKNYESFKLDNVKAFIKEECESTFSKQDPLVEAFINKQNDPNIATANLCVRNYMIDGVLFSVLMTNRRIEAGEQLGYDYEKTFWQLRNKPFCYFHKSTGAVYNPAPAVLSNKISTDFLNKAAEIYQEGVDFYKQGQFDEAIEKLNESLKSFDSQNNSKKAALCLSTLASCYRDKNQLEKAICSCQLAQKKNPNNENIAKKLTELQVLKASSTVNNNAVNP